MRRVAVHEYTRLYRGSADVKTGAQRGGRLYLSDVHFRRLRNYDEGRAKSEHYQIFDWRRRYAIAQQWVGVIQVPGLSVEILPKIAPRACEEKPEAQTEFSRKNLLYMLILAGKLPIRERDLADQSAAKSPLLETLIAIFAKRLFFELNRGRQHSYLRRRENLPVLKGKLAFSEHIKHNIARKDRFFVEHDEFLPDTALNRIFKAACRRLFETTSTTHTQERLTYCLMLLDEVADISIGAHHFDKVIINRQNERFADLFAFSRLVLTERAPAAAAGAQNTFSLLFDMNVVYENFVAEFLRRYVLTDDLADCKLFAQATSRLQHLVYRPPAELPPDYRPRKHGKKTLALKADLLIERGDQRLVMDTKWKRLSEEKGGRQGVSRDDLFQLFAYAHNYRAQHNVLLYPQPAGEVDVQVFDLPVREGGESPQQIHARFVDLNRDLRASRKALVGELRGLVSKMLLE